MPVNKNDGDIIGHQSIISYLQRHVTNGTVSHAYLFYGPSQVGKALVAEVFVKNILKNGANLNSCFDFTSIERLRDEKTQKLKKNISIEQIRSLIQKLSLGTFDGGYKVAIIKEADYLSKEAANALLKTLEEPTKKTVIILLSENLQKIPETVISRCQNLKFLPVDNKEIQDHLVASGVKEELAKNIASLSYGRPGLAVEYFKNKEKFRDYKKTIEQLLNIDADVVANFKLINDIVDFKDQEDIQGFLTAWEKLLRDLLLAKYGLNEVMAHHLMNEDIHKKSVRYSSANLLTLLNFINQAKIYIRANVNPRLVLENLVLSA